MTDTLDNRVEFDEESEDFVYGAGIGANIGEKFNLRFEYEKYDIQGLDDADALWLTAAWRFSRIVRRLQPDVIHAHDPHGVAMAGLALSFSAGAARGGRVPALVAAVMPQADPGALDWQAVHPHAFRRAVIDSPTVQAWLRRGFSAAFAGLGINLALSDR